MSKQPKQRRPCLFSLDHVVLAIVLTSSPSPYSFFPDDQPACPRSILRAPASRASYYTRVDGKLSSCMLAYRAMQHMAHGWLMRGLAAAVLELSLDFG